MVLFGYLFIASMVFAIWFTIFWNDAGTPKNDLISWIALALGPLLWPIVLPISLLQLWSKKPAVQQSKVD
ncbi:MAG: hypothetical protein HC942_01155 [Microcoleus sp. SU_5_6]|nr:hypothetical protein [Microcoleus sp. SU_5_6]